MNQPINQLVVTPEYEVLHLRQSFQIVSSDYKEDTDTYTVVLETEDGSHLVVDGTETDLAGYVPGQYVEVDSTLRLI